MQLQPGAAHDDDLNRLRQRAASHTGGAARRRLQSEREPDIPRPQVYLFGEIEGAVPCWPLIRLYCTWRLVFDSARWWVIQGETEGETFASEVSSQGLCVWNQPIMAHLACKSLQGWPRLVLEVRGVDSHGRNQLAGYGSWAIPAAAGTSEVLCRCWRPSGSGIFGRLRAYLLGSWPEVQRPVELNEWSACGGLGASRNGMETEDSVDVLLRLNVVHQHFPQNGIDA